MSSSRILGIVIVIGIVAGVAPYLYRHAPEWFSGRSGGTTTTIIQPPPLPTPESRTARPSAGRAAERPSSAPARDAAAISGVSAIDRASESEAPTRATAASAAAPSGRGAASAAARPSSPLFLAANAATWTRLAVTIDAPVRLRTGGEMAVGPNVIGANGFGAVVRAEDLVLPSAPYMSVIGRVCSNDECSKPFAIGNGALVCPSKIGKEGALELWTNNYRGTRVAETRSVYSQASGGFYVYASPAAPGACDAPATASSTAAEGAALADGSTLTRPEFVVSSRQGAWKPFFVPLGGPVRIHASGEIRPSGSLAPTSPDGIAVTDDTWWSYPGTSAIIVDAAHPLYVRGLAYQALIGRVCGASRCGAPFLVGRERTICAASDLRDRLELWINNTIAPKGLMEQTLPLSLQVFDLQARIGEYRFSLTGAAAAACAGNAAGTR